MNFETTHVAFIQHHLLKRKGERRGRLERGHREAEQLFCRNVWWPLRLNFDDCIQNSKCSIGGDSPISVTLLS